MGNLLQTLKDIHQLLSELADAKAQVQRAPQQLQGKRSELARREQALQEAHDQLTKNKLAIHEKEVSLKAGEQRVRDQKVKLNLCKSNKEYSALLEEIKNLAAANSRLEEEILELLTEQESRIAAQSDQEKARSEAQRELDEFTKLTQYKVEKFTDRIRLLEEEIQKAETRLDPTVVAEYRRLAKTRGAEALAACIGAVCQACYTELTPQMSNELLMDRVVYCKSCGAMLYLS